MSGISAIALGIMALLVIVNAVLVAIAALLLEWVFGWDFWHIVAVIVAIRLVLPRVFTLEKNK